MSGADHVYGGLYRAVVVGNNDPTHTFLLDLQIPAVLGKEVVTGVKACLPSVSGQVLPKVGTTAWVMFEQGNARMPVWLGVLTPPVGEG